MRYEADDRFGTAWNAATLMVQGHVEDALELLEGFACPDLDDWSRGVLAGCAHLRRSQEHIRKAEYYDNHGREREARHEWLAATAAWQSAAAERGPAPSDRRSDNGARLPDPWPHIVELFRDHLEERRTGDARRAG